jgi:hypothetical protein
MRTPISGSPAKRARAKIKESLFEGMIFGPFFGQVSYPNGTATVPCLPLAGKGIRA